MNKEIQTYNPTEDVVVYRSEESATTFPTSLRKENWTKKWLFEKFELPLRMEQ